MQNFFRAPEKIGGLKEKILDFGAASASERKKRQLIRPPPSGPEKRATNKTPPPSLEFLSITEYPRPRERGLTCAPLQIL